MKVQESQPQLDSDLAPGNRRTVSRNEVCQFSEGYPPPTHSPTSGRQVSYNGVESGGGSKVQLECKEEDVHFLFPVRCPRASYIVGAKQDGTETQRQ